MPEDTPIRRVAMRKWSKLTVAGAAVGLAVSAPSLAAGLIAGGVEQLWLVQATGAEGGEGGESGSAAVKADDIVRLLVGLAKIEAHLLTGMELERSGDSDAAKAQFLVTVNEIYPGIAEPLKARKAPAFGDALQTLAKTSGAESEVGFQVVSAGIIAARTALAPSPKEALTAVLALVREAAVDFEAGVQAGLVVELGEYRDARAYLIVARAMTGDLGVSGDTVVQAAAEKSSKALDEVIATLPDVTPKGELSEDAGLILSAAARIELAAYQVK
jgi:hypothetical protein